MKVNEGKISDDKREQAKSASAKQIINTVTELAQLLKVII